MKKYYKKGEKTRYYLILILIVLLITSIGYAVFTEQLDISGTVSGSANFKVYFAEATVTDSTKGTATINEVEKLHTHGTVPSGGEEEPPVSTEWTQTGTTVTNGEVTLEVGQAVTGYEANGVDGWYVLGAENGKLLITTNTNVGENVLLAGKDGYTDGLDILNTAVVNYKDANLADNVRIINGDDLNRVTGFSPEGTNLGQVSEYGNEVTYYWDGTSNPYYSTTNQLSGSGSTSHSGGFYYPTESGWECSPVSTTASEESKEIITTLTSTYYYYYANSFLATDNPAYTLLFANTGAYPGDTGTYWLGSKYVSCTNSSANFGFRGVINGGVHTNGVAFTSGAHNGHSMGLRPVVTLKSSVNVTSEGVITND